MSAKEKLLQDRIEWLTRAVRGLLKMEFGRTAYEEMAVGKADAALRAREAVVASAAAQVEAFMTEPSDEEARKKLEKMFPPEGKEAS